MTEVLILILQGDSVSLVKLRGNSHRVDGIVNDSKVRWLAGHQGLIVNKFLPMLSSVLSWAQKAEFSRKTNHFF